MKESQQLMEIINFLKNFKVKNFDIAKMETEGLVTLIFERNQEAEYIKQILEEKKGYKVDFTHVTELYEIPEMDEANFNQN